MTNENRSPWGRRDFLLRAGGAGLATIAGPTLLSACSRQDGGGGGGNGGGGGILQQLKDQGFVRAGFANEQPYGFTNDEGKLTGESVELGRAVFKELGIPELQGKQVEWDGLIPGLTAGQFDFVAAGMFINPDRCEQVAFSNPDYKAATSFMVPEGNPNDITRFKDIVDNPDLTLCVLNGTVEQGYAADLGVPEGQLQTSGSQSDAYGLLETERVDAVALTNISLNWLLDQRDGPFEVTKGFTPTIDGEEQVGAGAFAFQQAHTELVDAVNEQLEKFKESGRLLEIIEPFGFTKENLPGDLTAQQLCKA